MNLQPLTVDFVFVYEVKQRELDSILLVAAELENRGYSVAFINTWYALEHYIPRYHAKVVVVSACYNDATYEFFTGHVEKFDKVVNLQWEQVRHNYFLNDPNINNNWSFSGIACETRHVCWGNQSARRLQQKFNVREDCLFLGGYIPLDYYRRQFRPSKYNRAKLFQEYGLRPNVKTVLFISSFTFSTLPANQLRFFDENLSDRLQQFFSEQHAAICAWIDQLLTVCPNIQFIYRPHPAECNCALVEALVKKHTGFFMISNESIRYWCLSVDKIYNWNSTSMIEAYASGTESHLLHPLPLEPDFAYPLFDNCTCIDTFEEFVSSVTAPPLRYGKKGYRFPLSKKMMVDYYSIDETPSYLRVSNYLYDTFNDKTYRSPVPKYNRPTPSKPGEDSFDLEYEDEAAREYSRKKAFQNYEEPAVIQEKIKLLKKTMKKRFVWWKAKSPLDVPV